MAPRIHVQCVVVAQRLEHFSDKEEAVGSNPSDNTESVRGLAWCRRGLPREL